MKRTLISLALINISFTLNSQIIDHNCTVLRNIPTSWIDLAKSSLHIAYEHTSHGSQLIDGMTGLNTWKGSTYAWNNGGSNGALDIHDHGISGWSDLADPDRTAWAASTRTYLNNPVNSDVNVVIWSWCAGVTYSTEADINTYLSLMTALENDYPKVKFVYMTGHLDGTGLTGNLHLRNEQIRAYCRTNNKILYDFADIESYAPDGIYYGNKHPTDGCNYDFNGDGATESSGDPALPTGGDKNWAIDWQNSHTVNVDWYNTTVAHTQPLNGNMKAYAAWWLWARIAGWDGSSTGISETGINVMGDKTESMKIIVTSNEIKILLNDDFISWEAALYNLQGVLVLSKLVENDVLVFDISFLHQGMYFVVLSKGENKRVTKVIKP